MSEEISCQLRFAADSTLENIFSVSLRLGHDAIDGTVGLLLSPAEFLLVNYLAITPKSKRSTT